MMDEVFGAENFRNNIIRIKQIIYADVREGCVCRILGV
jgi:adenine specific DNA methylase Mod